MFLLQNKKHKNMSWIVSGLFLLLSVSGSFCQSEVESGDSSQVYKIEGKIIPPENPPPDWHSVTTVTIDGGKRRSFLKEDNSFVFQVLWSQTGPADQITVLLI